MPERDDDELDDESLSSMRAVWVSMRDEEPPAAGMSALMAAAAAKAEQMRPQPAWWERVVAQLRRPPVLAFATVMILIGGAVVVTRQSADEKVESLSADEAPARELQLREAEQPQGQAPAATVTPVEVAPSADPAPPAGKDVVVAKPDPKPKATPKPVRVKAEEKPGKNEPDRYRRFDDADAPKTGFSQSDGRGDTTVLQTPGADSHVIVPTSPPPPPPEKPAETKKPEPAGEIVRSEGTKNQAPSNEQLVRQAERAATRGDCATVRTVVAKLKQQDEALFKARLGKNAAVARCL